MKSKKILKYVILPDLHLREKIHKTFYIVLKFIKEYKPDEIILNGDFMDCFSLSHWNKNKRKEVEGKRYQKEINCAKVTLELLRNHCKNITWLEGNHENWIEQYISEHPGVDGILNIRNMINLHKLGINFVEMNKLYPIGYKNARCYVTHGMWTNQYHSFKHLIKLGCNIIYGHVHNAQTHQMNMKMQAPYMSYGLGWLGEKSCTEYLKGIPPNWIHQFAIVECLPQVFNVTPINVINNKFIYNNKLYS